MNKDNIIIGLGVGAMICLVGSLILRLRGVEAYLYLLVAGAVLFIAGALMVSAGRRKNAPKEFDRNYGLDLEEEEEEEAQEEDWDLYEEK